MAVVYLSNIAKFKSLTAGSGITLTDSDGSITVTSSNVQSNGAINPAHLADGSAANDTIYYSTTASKLVYKDSGGSVHNLY